MHQLMQNVDLVRQQQAQLAEGARTSAGLRELAAKDRRHRVRALLWLVAAWRARRRGDAAKGYRSWDH